MSSLRLGEGYSGCVEHNGPKHANQFFQYFTVLELKAIEIFVTIYFFLDFAPQKLGKKV